MFILSGFFPTTIIIEVLILKNVTKVATHWKRQAITELTHRMDKKSAFDNFLSSTAVLSSHPNLKHP